MVVQLRLSEAEFWASTPYQTTLRIQSARRGALESALFTGWMSERFAREQRLQGPNGYIREMLDGASAVDEEAEAEALFNRMASDWGAEDAPLDQPDDPE